MRKEEIECIGVDVSKNTLDVALFRGKYDSVGSRIRKKNEVENLRDNIKQTDAEMKAIQLHCNSAIPPRIRNKHQRSN